MKVVKIVGWVILGIVTLAVVAGVAVTLLFDPNQLKPYIQQQVEARTGQQLTIDGDIKLSLFPWVGVELGPVSLANVAGFGKQPLARVTTVDVKVKLVPLLRRRQLVTDVIRLEGLNLRLVRKRNGRSNWQHLIASQTATAPEVPATSAGSGAGTDKPAGAGTFTLTEFAVGGLKIADATVIWDDRQAARKFAFRKLHLDTGALKPGEPVSIDVGFNVQSSDPQLSGTVALKTTLSADPELQTLSLSEGTLTLNLSGDGLPGGELAAVLDLQLDVDFRSQLAEIRGLTGQAYGLDLNADLKGTRILDAPSFTGSLQIAEFSPRKLLETLGVESMATADPAVLGRASLNSDLLASGDSLKLNNLRVVLDDSELTGTFGVNNFATPALRFNLAVNRIDLDRYLPPPETEQGPAVAAAPAATPPPASSGNGSARQGGASAAALESLRNLDLRGSARIGELVVSRLHLSKVVLKINAGKGQIRLDPIKLQLYGGRLQGKAGLNVRGQQPKLSANYKVGGIQLDPLLTDLNGESTLTGTARMQADLKAVGMTSDEIESTLKGTLSLVVRKGMIKGVDIGQIIREADAALSGKPPPPRQGPNRTDFSQMSASLVANKGFLTNNDLLLSSPVFRAQGKGRVHLPTEKIDYLASVFLVGTPESVAGRDLSSLRGVEIPVRITGSFSQPDIRPDLQAMLRAEAGRQLDAHKEELQEEAQKRLQKELDKQLGGALKGLFGSGN